MSGFFNPGAVVGLADENWKSYRSTVAPVVGFVI